MLFAATILIAIGYTLMYAGVKGNAYKINGTPVWKAPWLPVVATFTGQIGAGVDTSGSGNVTEAATLMVATASSPAPTDITNNPAGVTVPAVQ